MTEFGAAEWWIPLAFKAMQSAGFAPPSDPEWTPAWKAAVKKFQKAKGLTQDGIPGPNTWRQLQPTMPALTDTWAKRVLEAAFHERNGLMVLACASIAADQKPDIGKKILGVLTEWHDWLDQKGARKTLWVAAGGSLTALPPPKRLAMRGEVGLAPIVIAGPFLVEGAIAATAAAEVVATVGAAAAAAGAAWLAAKSIAILSKADWPDLDISAGGTVVTAPPIGGLIPGEPPRKDFDLTGSLKRWRTAALAGLGMLLAILTQGWGVVASLLPFAAAAAAAAGGGAGIVLLLLLAFLAAFGRKFRGR